MGTVPWGGCAGHASRAVGNKPGQLEQKGEKLPALLLGEGRPLWEEGRASPAPAHGHCPAWHQRAGMALVQAACLSRPWALV